MRRDLLFSLVVLALLSFCACEKEVIDNTDKNFPIDLTAESLGQLTKLTWTPTNISTFEEYLIVRSSDSIPTGIEPTNNQIIARIDDYEEATFTDGNISFEEEFKTTRKNKFS